jgi:acetolactate synthase-1/2/3 large subunit
VQVAGNLQALLFALFEQPALDFAGVAEGFGAKGLTIDHPGELADGLRELLATDGPAVLAVHVEKEENVYPMVPAGASLHEMRLGTLA